jgi:nicotinamidase/pyrazinamidase
MFRTLVIIDPQNDFCKAPTIEAVAGGSGDIEVPGGSLYVEGADKDMIRLSEFICENSYELDDIYVTFDDHDRLDIAHPMWWVDEDENYPDPFTVITYRDVVSGKWKASVPEYQEWSEKYLKMLDDQGNYPHVIWPYHCIAATEGAAMVPVLVDSLAKWGEVRFKSPEIIRKGQDPLTEHYSAVKAEVVTSDPRTDVNQDFIEELKGYDEVYVAGEALSHCLANTVRDMIRYDVDPKKIIILEDVPTFEELGEAFKREMELLGVRFIKTEDYVSDAE